MSRPDKASSNDASGQAAPARAWLNVFVIITGFLTLFMVGLVVSIARSGGEGDAWDAAMRKHLAREGAGFDAMGPVLEAVEEVDWKLLERQRSALDATARSGWSPDTELERTIESHQPVVALIGRSAALPRSSFPSLLEYEVDRPLPRFDRFHVLSLLMIANARRLAAEGSQSEAIQRLIELATLGTRFSRPASEASYSSHGLSITMIEQAVGVAGEIIRDSPQLPVESLRRIELQLSELESKYVPVRAAAYDELDLFLHVARNRLKDQDDVAVVLQFYDTTLSRNDAAQQASEWFVHAAPLPQEIEKLKPLIDDALNRPHHHRPILDDVALSRMSQNPLALLPLRPVGALSMREGMMLARIQMVRALCQRLTNPDGAITAEDPFSGNPLTVVGNVILSVGPDGVSQGGGKLYNPQDGLASPGDLVLSLGGR
jgi:hypothetical protein